jgi:hypothetical protein
VHLPPCPSLQTPSLPFPVGGILFSLISLSSLPYPSSYLTCSFRPLVLPTEPFPSHLKGSEGTPSENFRNSTLLWVNLSAFLEQEMRFLVQGFGLFLSPCLVGKTTSFSTLRYRWVSGFRAFSGYRSEISDFSIKVSEWETNGKFNDSCDFFLIHIVISKLAESGYRRAQYLIILRCINWILGLHILKSWLHILAWCLNV